MSRSNPIEIGEEEEQKNEGAGYAIHKKKKMILNPVGEMIGSRSTNTILKNLGGFFFMKHLFQLHQKKLFSGEVVVT
jgi:hypothetical protein